MSHSVLNTLPSGALAFGAGRGSFVGKRVGPYTICLELASGGMASVFLARAAASTEGAELVALKLIHPHLAERRDFVEMFVDEAQVGSRLRHRNVCDVLGFDRVDDTYYLAMEYLMGESMSAIFRRTSRRALDAAKHAALVVRVIADACAGLHAAHVLRGADGTRLNVVHRDISPENLFVTYAGVTKVVDFGLACAKHQRHHTRTGVIKGKFAYVCPEALQGVRVDLRADIWGLGVVLWEALTGRRLFRGASDTQTLAAVVDGPIPAPSAIRSGLPKALDRPVLRALSRKAADRQGSAEQLARELFEAYPAAAAVSEAQIAKWMTSLFAGERRSKSQIIELVQALSRPESALEPEIDSAPTRVMVASSAWPRGRAGAPRTRSWVGGIAIVGSLLGAASWIRLPSTSEGDAGQQTPRVVEVAEVPTAPTATTSVAASVEAASVLATEELVEGAGYVLEIVEPSPGKKGFRLRIQPDLTVRPKPTPVAEPSASMAEPSAPPVSRPPAVASESDVPPVWLRDFMEPPPRRVATAPR